MSRDLARARGRLWLRRFARRRPAPAPPVPPAGPLTFGDAALHADATAEHWRARAVDAWTEGDSDAARDLVALAESCEDAADQYRALHAAETDRPRSAP